MKERILIIDDEKDFLEVMKERMNTRGMEVSTAASAKDALEIINKESFDAIIMDFQMPGMNGIEALKAIKAKKPELQIILLTGKATIKTGIEAMKEGALDLIEKPADLGELTQKIQEARANKMIVIEKQNKEKVDEILDKYGF